VAKRPIVFYYKLSDGNCTEGREKTLRVSVDEPAATFTWYKDSKQITGAAGATYSFIPTTADNGSRVRVVATSPNRETVESELVLSVSPPPAPRISFFSVAPSQVIAGNALTFTTGFEWLSPAADRVSLLKDGSEVADISGLYFSKVAAVSDSGSYVVRAWSGASFSDSATIIVTVEEVKLSIASLPRTVSGKVGKTVSLTARATSNLSAPNYSYQWLRNGVPIRGATKSALKHKVSAADRNVNFSVVVEVAGKRATSSRARMAVTK
jgi:hypothetical protein